MNSSVRVILTAFIAVIVGYYIQVVVPYAELPTHGSGPYLSETDTLVMMGQDVYKQEGCFYCHTKNLRPFAWEVARFSDTEKMGYFPLPEKTEYRFSTPNMKGTVRIGPDLSRVSTKMNGEEMKDLLTSFVKKDVDAAKAYHQYSSLFSQKLDENDGVGISWKIRGIMQSGVPMNEPLQRSSFTRMKGQTRGDALIAYLLSLGKEQQQFAGNYYK